MKNTSGMTQLEKLEYVCNFVETSQENGIATVKATFEKQYIFEAKSKNGVQVCSRRLNKRIDDFIYDDAMGLSKGK